MVEAVLLFLCIFFIIFLFSQVNKSSNNSDKDLQINSSQLEEKKVPIILTEDITTESIHEQQSACDAPLQHSPIDTDPLQNPNNILVSSSPIQKLQDDNRLRCEQTESVSVTLNVNTIPNDFLTADSSQENIQKNNKTSKSQSNSNGRSKKQTKRKRGSKNSTRSSKTTTSITEQDWYKEAEEIIKYIWPEADCSILNDFDSFHPFTRVMFNYPDYSQLYGLYEHLLSDYPKPFTERQLNWIIYEIKYTFRMARYYEISDDKSIFEEYKYLKYPSHLQKILLDNANEAPALIAAICAWSVYQCDIECLKTMLSVYHSLNEDAKTDFLYQFSDSLTRTRDEVFDHTVQEIQEVIKELDNNIDPSSFKNYNDKLHYESNDRINYESVRKYLYQGCSIQKLLDKIQKEEIWLNNDKKESSCITPVYFKYPNGKQGDIDMYIASEFGENTQSVSGLIYCTFFTLKNLSYTECILYLLFFNNLPQRFEDYNSNNFNTYTLLSQYNNYHKLRDLLFDIGEPDLYYLSKHYNKANGIYRKYLKKNVRKRRDDIYQLIVTNGEASSKWKSEQQVYTLVHEQYKDAIYQYRTHWLGLQSIDIFIPSISTGIEYQGIQHYKPIEYFGGDTTYQETLERDNRKKALCEQQGVRIIYWAYNEPIDEATLNKKLLG